MQCPSVEPGNGPSFGTSHAILDDCPVASRRHRHRSCGIAGRSVPAAAPDSKPPPPQMTARKLISADFEAQLGLDAGTKVEISVAGPAEADRSPHQDVCTRRVRELLSTCRIRVSVQIKWKML